MQNRASMTTPNKSRVLAPAERVDYSRYYGLLIKKRSELLNLDQRDRQEIEQRQTTGEAPGDQADGSVIDTSSDYFLALADRDRHELIEVRDALEKLHHGSYGNCEKCKRPISPKRLSLMPHARLCTGCQSDVEAHERVHHLHPTPKL